MRELNQIEIGSVAGGVIDLAATWKAIRQIIREMPAAYQDAITSTADMMCIATSKC